MLGEIRITSWLTRELPESGREAYTGREKVTGIEQGEGEGEAVGILNMNMIL